MSVLITGGTGYIGSHTCVELINNDFDVVIVDNLCNSKREVLNRIEKITGTRPKFYKVDLQDKTKMDEVFKKNKFDSVIHFAGLKAVGESCEKPLSYYQNNVNGSLILFELMKEHNVKNLVFSSSATVYGDPDSVPITEKADLRVTNPYGRTKLIIEDILRDLGKADSDLNVILLRYFNPVGAHKSGLIGEDPTGIPNNLLPYITQVAVGKLERLSVFGDDYNTKDGTGVRDYIHVVDLAVGHIKALEKLQQDKIGVKPYNLGTGEGYSVLQMIEAFSKASGEEIPYQISARRAGDIATSFADPSLAERELGWKAQRNINNICEDAWNWQKKNPQGY